MDMDRMLMEKEGKENKEDFHVWVEKFCARKFNCEFSVEMSRSCREMLRYFCGEDE